MTSTNALRTRFQQFFAERDHRVVASGSLVPANDPTLLFTNAGMAPFKDVFLGRETRSYSRAVSAQRCVRAGGKHNDLENVGYTARHHTFFEMLGNFSFGDYFKREAIHYAWEFLTGELGLPAEKLWVTVYEEDAEAERIWLEDIGVSPEHFSRIGAADNFWTMGDTGPCGPCSEIFYDHGPEVAGGPPGTPEEDGDRYVEIWNLVFMQYNRSADGTLEDLPSPSVDTGMGLERIAAVVQGTHDNYSIDIFQRLMTAAAQVIGTSDTDSSSLKVIADHIRATAFLVVDGVLPSNEGRGYVLRRIMRRAIRHGYKLGVQDAFFHKLVTPLAGEMGQAYPELAEAAGHVERVIAQEEARFAQTLAQGMRILEDAIGGLSSDTIPGETVFKLYDTYGFPADLTNDVARERGLVIDAAGFERAMDAQRKRARKASHFGVDYNKTTTIAGDTEFTGYENVEGGGHITALLQGGERVQRLAEGATGVVVLDVTPFYAESGGQVGDAGVLQGAGFCFRVTDTQKTDGQHLHFGQVEAGDVAVGEPVEAHIDVDRRNAIVLNHSATHLIHAALRKVLGTHVRQKGSLVAPDRLRFDFAHYEPVTPDQLADIEAQVNAAVRADVAGEFISRSYDDAIADGALAFFGEKYGDIVRVVRYGEYSTELCGGTHVARTGRIGLVKFTEERGVASGVRRIEAVTGAQAVQLVQASEDQLRRIAGKLKAVPAELDGKLDRLLDKVAELEKQVGQLSSKMASAKGADLAGSAVTIDDFKLLAARMDGADRKTLRETVDALKDKLGTAAVMLGAAEGDKVALIAGVTKDLTKRIAAGDLVNHVAKQVGGRGGGRPDMAQAGGSQPENLDAALAGVQAWIEEQVAGASAESATN